MDIKPIKSEADYQEALKELECLMEMEPKVNSPDGDKLDVLATLIEAYEAKVDPIDSPNPVEALLFALEHQKLTFLPPPQKRAPNGEDRKFIYCNTIEYRSGLIEVTNGIHPNCVNLETWMITGGPEVLPDSVAYGDIPDECTTYDAELELNTENMRELLVELLNTIQLK